MFKALMQRADGTEYEIFCEGERDLIELTSIAIASIKPYYKGTRIIKEKGSLLTLVGHIDDTGKYTKEDS